MLNHYPAWKNILIVAVVLFGALFAVPNLYGEDPAVQISPDSLTAAGPALVAQSESALQQAGIAYKAAELREGRVLVRFANTEVQLRAADALRRSLGDDYVVALNLASRMPEWMRGLGLQTMNLGLDLRGGVHFLLAVDINAALEQANERYAGDIRQLLREKDIRYTGVVQNDAGIRIEFRDAAELERAESVVTSQFIELMLSQPAGVTTPTLLANMTDARKREVQNFAVEQNITTLRNRVNELGVSEPIIQRQGQSHIVVELPGVQDTARAKEILGATATLEFRLVDTAHNAAAAESSGRAPLASRLYHTRDGRPVLLKRDVVVTGDQLTDARAGFDSQTGGPSVSITLDAAGARKMAETTAENVGKPMAVVFIENKTETEYVGDKEIKRQKKTEEVINVATIQGVFSSRFQITGLEQAEAHNLALLLRAGALAAPVDIVEERTVGPSLGQDNIERGFLAVAIGFLAVVVFMAIYYRVFGLIANVALFMNLVLIVALMSLLQATLTMPGIAGLVLTIGMAVDANVLINERVREEARAGNTPQAAIHAGYDRAFSAIADGNITTLIAALALYAFGSGPVKGFAVVLALGIITSMFTAIMGTRSLVNLIYGGRKVTRLHI